MGKENIANFGGDPGNVTIMGQSGGGAKVCTLAAMPKAVGLIHKVVALSGNVTNALSQDYSQKLGKLILEEAGLNPAEINKLQEMPWKDYLLLANKANAKLVKMTGGSGMMRGGFGPVADGVNVPKGTFFSDENGISADVPMIISSTFHEMAISRTSPELENITAEKAKEILKERAGYAPGFGDKAPEVYDAYAKAFPNAKPIEILIYAASSRKNVVETANAKIKQKAPVYVAWFGWESPLFSNRMRAGHCDDICFWFYNTDVMLTQTGGGTRPRELGEKMSDALVQFMKTGNPNCKNLPEWPKYTSENGEVMI